MAKKEISVASKAYPRAAPMNGPVHGVAIITAKNPVKKLWFFDIWVRVFENLSLKFSLPIKFKKIMKNKKSKNKLNPIDWSWKPQPSSVPNFLE